MDGMVEGSLLERSYWLHLDAQWVTVPPAELKSNTSVRALVVAIAAVMDLSNDILLSRTSYLWRIFLDKNPLVHLVTRLIITIQRTGE